MSNISGPPSLYTLLNRACWAVPTTNKAGPDVWSFIGQWLRSDVIKHREKDVWFSLFLTPPIQYLFEIFYSIIELCKSVHSESRNMICMCCLFNCSVDIGSGSRASGNGDRGIDGSSLMRPMSARASSQHSRRESFLYKCDTARDELSPSSRSSRSSINDMYVNSFKITF